MVDTTRPYHWGRKNENYAGPQRAQPASEGDRRMMDDIADLLNPSGYPTGSVAAEVAFLAREADHPVTSEELHYAGVYDHPDAESVQAFRQLRVDTLAELAAHADANELTPEDLTEVNDDEDFQDRAQDLSDDFTERNGHLARQYAGLSPDPVADLAYSAQGNGDHEATITSVRESLKDGYGRALAARYPEHGDTLADIMSNPARNHEEELVRSAARQALAVDASGGEEAKMVFSRALTEVARANAGVMDNKDLYRTWATADGLGSPAGRRHTVDLDKATRDLYVDHAEKVILSTAWRGAHTVANR